MAAEAKQTGIDLTDLDDLDPLSKRLNAATDELNHVLESIQNRLNAKALGVEKWLDTDDADCLGRRVSNEEQHEKRVVECSELGYGRFGDGWALLVRVMSYRQVFDAAHPPSWEYAEDAEIVSDPKPLLKAARNLRVQAVDRIPKLIDALKSEAEKVIDAVEKAKKIAESLK